MSYARKVNDQWIELPEGEDLSPTMNWIQFVETTREEKESANIRWLNEPAVHPSKRVVSYTIIDIEGYPVKDYVLEDKT